MSEVAAVALWYVAIQALALAIAPLVIQIFVGLPDRGIPYSKVVGWLLVSGMVWLLGMLGLLQFTRATVIVALILIGALCWWRWGTNAIEALRAHSSWLDGELVFGIAFLAVVWIRAHTPEILGQEKFMDFAIMNSFLMHAELPAPDPWLSGYGMPYYHLNYFMFALIAKLAGTPGPIAYNLALSTVFAFGALGLYSLVRNVTRLGNASARFLGWASGVLAAVFVLVLGNLEAVFEMLSIRSLGSPALWSALGIKGLNPGQAASGLWPADGGWWWRASRIVPTTKPDGINEFPYFSFLLGDLHPHYMAIPLDLLVITLGTVALVKPEQIRSWPWRIVSVIALAALIPANTWDVPVFWGVFAICMAIAAWRLQKPVGGILQFVVMFGMAAMAVVPYMVGYASQPLGIGIVDEHTPVPSFLIIFGAFVLITIVWILLPPPKGSAEKPPPAWLVAIPIVGAVLGIVTSVLDMRTLGIALVLGALCLHRLVSIMFWRLDGDRQALSEVIAGLLLTVGFLVIAGTEILFIRDSFGTRMNTVFKFHYNAWVLLALGCALALMSLIGQRGIRRAAAVIVSAAVILLGGIYPLGATLTKTNHFLGVATLDGSSFARRQYENDLIAIDWLRGMGQPRSSIVEAVGGDYTDFGRVSTFSGMPTPIGWIGHELQWRGPSEEFQRRERLVQDLYQARDGDQAQRTLDLLGASHVFVGRLEREKYGADTADRLRAWLPVVFQRGDALVLQRVGAPQR